jgi:hypothetical protein
MVVATEVQWWEKQGYLCGKPIGGGLWICVASMVYTWRLMICDEGSVHEFYCYPKERGLAPALEAYEAWEGVGDPLSGWVKHHPSERRRP